MAKKPNPRKKPNPHMPSCRKPAACAIPVTAWAPAGGFEDPHAELIATLDVSIAGQTISLHLSAYAVVDNEETGMQDGVTPATEEDLQELCAAHDAGRMETIKIEGRDYVLFAHTYSS